MVSERCGELGYTVAPSEATAERDSFGDVVLMGRLRAAIDRLNLKIPTEARDEAFRKVLLTNSPSLVANNRKFHWMQCDGVEVEYRRADGSIAGDLVRLIDFDDPANNDWLAVNQFTVSADDGAGRKTLATRFKDAKPRSAS